MGFDGLLTHTMTVQRYAAGVDAAGGFEETWADLYTNVPCRVRQAGADESFQRGKETVDVSHIIYCRPKAFTEKDRIVFDSRTFEIRRVGNWNEQDDYYRLQVTEEA